MAKFQPKKRSGKVSKNYRTNADCVLPGFPSGVKVPGSSPGDLEKALKVLKRKMKDSGKLEEYRNRLEHIKPAVKRRKKMKDAVRAEKNRVRLQKRWDKLHPCWAIMTTKGAR